MGWSDLYHKQRQAQQLREIERNTAIAAGAPPRKLTWSEKNVMGVKDPKRVPVPLPIPAPAAQVGIPDARIAQLEARVAQLEARLQWLMDKQNQQVAPFPPPPPPSA